MYSLFFTTLEPNFDQYLVSYCFAWSKSVWTIEAMSKWPKSQKTAKSCACYWKLVWAPFWVLFWKIGRINLSKPSGRRCWFSAKLKNEWNRLFFSRGRGFCFLKRFVQVWRVIQQKTFQIRCAFDLAVQISSSLSLSLSCTQTCTRTHSPLSSSSCPAKNFWNLSSTLSKRN